MPELPEVETIVRGLREILPGRTISAATVLWPRSIGYPSATLFSSEVIGRRIASVGRRGKYIHLELEEGHLLVHLKMSGRLRLAPAGAAPGAYSRVVLELDDGQQLRFDDPRKFGRMYLVPESLQVTAPLGPEPLGEGLTLEDFRRLLAHRSGRLKPLLLNQAFLAGLGNIYADEALFTSRLHPLRRARSLTAGDQERLYEAIRSVLSQAIVGYGTTLDDNGYVDVRGERGTFQDQIAVYGRTGKPCTCCGAPVERIVIGGRSAHFCPRCQPLEAPEETKAPPAPAGSGPPDL
jgi:formamidopyrimidine-DNA glycosylase